MVVDEGRLLPAAALHVQQVLRAKLKRRTPSWWRWASGCAPARAPRHDAQGRGAGGRRVRAPPGQPGVRHRQRVILVLLQVAGALQCSLAELLGDVTTSSPEWLLLRELLDTATKPRCAACAWPWARLLGTGGRRPGAQHARGADRAARCRQVHAGPDAGRRPGLPVRRAEPRDREVRRLQHQRDPGPVRPERLPPLRAPRAGGGDPDLPRSGDRHARRPGVSDAATFNLLLAHCTTVWLQADPEDHMRRVRPRATCGRWRPAARRWTTSRASWPGAPRSTRRPSSCVDTSAQPLEPPSCAAQHGAAGTAAGLQHEQHIAFCLTIPSTCIMMPIIDCQARIILRTRSPDEHPPRVDYQTHPSQYRHWKLSFEGPVATLAPTSTRTPACAPATSSSSTATTWAWTSS
jgi:XRE family aerobic/anaerobic benzoate catabolism transcriptional regulator